MKSKSMEVEVVETSVATFKERVSSQYRTVCEKTGEFFREVVKFGALLNEVENFIGNEAKRDGSGLKGWLDENCPEVNYNTAKGYKAMAAKCAKMIGGGSQALACLQGRDEVIEPASQESVEVDASFLEKRDALFEQVESRRQLEQMWFEFCGAKNKGGRPKASTEPLPKLSRREEAKAIWNGVMLALTKSSVKDAIPLLEEKVAETCYDELTYIRGLLKKHLEEFK